MVDPRAELKDLVPEHDFLIAIDSDGCAFDSMEIKHKECFIPNIIKHWNLQPVSKYARAAAEFVNLYSKWRGMNRFPALIMVFDLLHDWQDVKNRNVDIPYSRPLRDWIKNETKLSNNSLKSEVEKTREPVLEKALKWSESVNSSVVDIVHGVPPFPNVRESLDKINRWADIIVCSATPYEALKREWEEHKISDYVKVIAGQEMGNKGEHIHAASNGKYARDHVVMIGDAPGDLQAAKVNSALFYPINPGMEEVSWKTFLDEASDKVFEGTYTREYESEIIADFEKLLPDTPPWKK